MASSFSSPLSRASELGFDAETNSSSSFINLPPSILDAFVPGYSFLADFFLHFGIDISFFVSLFALALVSSTALRFAVAPVPDFFVRFMCSTIVVEEYDPIYDHILKWMAAHKRLQNLRSLRGRSQGQYNDDSDSEDEIEIPEELEDDDIFNFNGWSARAEPKYEPYKSSGFFVHKRHVFKIHRDRERVTSEWSSAVRDRERLFIIVLWRSTKPIKRLIGEARELYLGKKTSVTVIRRPTSKEQRRHHHAWQQVAARPSRSMETVVLDDVQKFAVLQDINDFLNPKTARWYSNRGIPYRRGYLFHGPPGTGKTSLSFALAGVFGLDIYCLSLSEVTLTEEDLIMLFNTLPKRCIVLLEDIDSAGVSRPRPLSRRKKRSSGKSKKASSEISKVEAGLSKNVEILVQKVADAALKSKGEHGVGKLTNAITISGLLNAIDGVASQEGRVLIMTTNFPNKLDAALVRPGRVDLQIEFALASRQQIKELFLRMYSADSDDLVRQPTKITQLLPISLSRDGSHEKCRVKSQTLKPALEIHAAAAKDFPAPLSIPSTTTQFSDESTEADLRQRDLPLHAFSELSGSHVEDMAEKFADVLPDLTFSPAEIQSYLLMRKKSPKQALLDVEVWRNEELAKKEKAKREGEGMAKVDMPVKANGDVSVEQLQESSKDQDTYQLLRKISGGEDSTGGSHGEEAAKDERKYESSSTNSGGSSEYESDSGSMSYDSD